MDYFSLVERRESCRDYAPTPVEREKLVKMLEAARLAPSACNSQPWSFVVATKPDVVGPLAKCLQGMNMNKFTDACPAFIVICEEKASLAARFGGALNDQHYAQTDVGIATAQLCLAATAQGLSTCIIGWFAEDKLRALLDIPKTTRIRLVVAVGYSKEEKQPREKKRKPLDEIARFVEE